MAVVNAYYCRICDAEVDDCWSDAVPRCCGERMRIDMSKSKVTNFEWGGPRTYIHLRDEPFESRSELAKYAKDRNLMVSPSADKHHGARNDMFDNVGKLFSGKAFKGTSRGTNSLYTNGVQRSGK